MTINILNTLEVKSFEAEVHHIFQSQGNKLAPTCRMRRIPGNKTQFPVLGKLVTAERTVGTPLVTSNQTATGVEVTVTKFSVAQYTDIFLESETNFDARQEAAQSVAMALGRTLDQVIIDGLAASGTSKTVAKNVSGANDDLTVAAVRKAAELLDDDSVPGTDRWAVVNPSGLHHLIGEDAASSIDFINLKPNITGNLPNFYGFNFITIGNLDSVNAGLPFSTPDRTNFFYHKTAMGCAVNMDIKVRVDYDAPMGAHLVSGFLSAGSKAIDATGIVDVTTDET